MFVLQLKKEGIQTQGILLSQAKTAWLPFSFVAILNVTSPPLWRDLDLDLDFQSNSPECIQFTTWRQVWFAFVRRCLSGSWHSSVLLLCFAITLSCCGSKDHVRHSELQSPSYLSKEGEKQHMICSSKTGRKSNCITPGLGFSRDTTTKVILAHQVEVGVRENMNSYLFLKSKADFWECLKFCYQFLNNF